MPATSEFTPVKPSQLSEALKFLYKAGRPAFTWGTPGIGKSEIHSQVVNALKLELGIPDFRMWDFRAVLYESVDFRGPQSVQNALLQLALDRRLGDYTMPPGWMFMAAGNFESDGGGVQRMNAALCARFIHFHLEPDVKDWVKWACDPLLGNINPIVVGAVRWKPDLLNKFDRNAKAFPTPRATKFVSDIVDQNPPANIMLPMIEGTVGKGAAIEHLAFQRLYANLPPIDSILLNPTTAGFVDGSEYAGLSAEAAYAKDMHDDPGQENPPEAQGGGDDCATGDFVQGLGGGDEDDGQQPADGQQQQPQGMTELDWQIAAQEATMLAKHAGQMPGGAERAIKEARERPEDWRAIMQEFVSNVIPVDSTWNTPNRKYLAHGLYLPGVYRENCGKIVIAVDTSGSVDEEMLSKFGAVTTAIMLEVRPEAVHVIYCDADVNGYQMFTPDDGEVKLTACGGGGTYFSPAFAKAAELDIDPVCFLYLTDLENGRETVEEPSYPVLWVTPPWVTKEAPFGRTVRMLD